MKGILFKEPLFAAVIDGTKTQTRRVVKDAINLSNNISVRIQENGTFGFFKNGFLIEIFKPRYKVGDTVYLKEPYAETSDSYGSPVMAYKYDNKAFLMGLNEVFFDSISVPCEAWTIDNFPACGKWKNKLFMPQIYARHFIKITAVHCEQLQDISDEDCFKEGIMTDEDAMLTERNYECCERCGGIRLYDSGGIGGIVHDVDCNKCNEKTFYCHNLQGRPYQTPQQAYAALIDKISGKGTWQSNPFVWVYEFKLIQNP